jgi:hypothetical protein
LLSALVLGPVTSAHDRAVPPGGVAGAADWIAEANQNVAAFGSSVAAAGDVNGDGYTDVIVGASSYTNGQTGEGRAFVYHGSASGPSTVPDWTAESDQAGANFGISVGTAGDVNGDGFGDVIVGAPNWWQSPSTGGAAFAYFGSATGLPAAPDWMGLGEGTYVAAQYGISVGTAGDANGDGFDELLVGAQRETRGQFMEGTAYGYNGPEP